MRSDFLRLDSDFLDIFHAVRKNVRKGSVDHIVDAIIYDGLFKENRQGQSTDLILEHMVFAMLGWLSMLQRSG